MASIKELEEALAAAKAQRDLQIDELRKKLISTAREYVQHADRIADEETYDEGEVDTGLILAERELETVVYQFSNLVDEVEADK